jgi:hypothetical protein
MKRLKKIVLLNTRVGSRENKDVEKAMAGLSADSLF